MSRPDLPPEIQVMLDWFQEAEQADVLKALAAIEKARPREWSMYMFSMPVFSRPVQRVFELGRPDALHYIPGRRESSSLLIAVSRTATSDDGEVQYDLEEGGLVPAGFRDAIRECFRGAPSPVTAEDLHIADGVIRRWLYTTAENPEYVHFRHTLRRLEPRVYGSPTNVQIEWTLHPFEV